VPGSLESVRRDAVRGAGAERGLCFHVIHGSFVDGCGIRTTVFLKGCPLRCLWCCNPEGQGALPELKYDAASCNGCGRCVDACQAGAITMSGADGRAVIDRSLCTSCGDCTGACHVGALDFFGEYLTVDELFEMVRKDDSYYLASGGGVTIGGGEPLFQPAFTYALMKKCQASCIPVAIDTCGYAVTEEQFQILREADLLLYDVKGLDPADHLRNTGVSNDLMLSNLAKLDDLGKAIIVRIPIIPGLTVTWSGAADLARFLAQLRSVQQVDLLPYHRYGDIKYERLGRPHELEAEPDAQELAEHVRRMLGSYGMNVQLGG